MAKNATSNAFIAAKKKRDDFSLSMGIQKIQTEMRSDNTFEEQHHHLLSCLEHATVLFIFQMKKLFLKNHYQFSN